MLTAEEAPYQQRQQCTRVAPTITPPRLRYLSSETSAGSGAISAACEAPGIAVKIDAATVIAKIVRCLSNMGRLSSSRHPL
jgi:hypothetical protein